MGSWDADQRTWLTPHSARSGSLGNKKDEPPGPPFFHDRVFPIYRSNIRR
jgi:hypothetical protein